MTTAEKVADVNHEQAEATKGPAPRELRSPAAFQQQSPGQKAHGTEMELGFGKSWDLGGALLRQGAALSGLPNPGCGHED